MWSSRGGENRRVLLIGDVGKAFIDADAVRGLPCEVHADVAGAVAAAGKNSFAAIAVVMSGLSADLGSVLGQLKGADSGAKIFLLAQMYEEPVAIQFVGAAANRLESDLSGVSTGERGAGSADDYLICPMEAKKFYESVTGFTDSSSKEAKRTNDEDDGAADMGGGGDETMEEKVRQLEKLATEDDLTGLKNRRYIWEFSRQIIERAKREKGRVTLLVFDIDNFKYYNDVYGHSAGDEVLKQAAVLMRRCCRGHDVVGRIGGDEFAVVFWDEPRCEGLGQEAERRSLAAEHPKEVLAVARRFRSELGKAEFPLLGPEGRGVLTISGGLASLGREVSTIEELFEQADKALLEAKRSGKNRIYLVGKPKSDISEMD